MAALDPQYMSILKKVLETRFVPFLPPLLGNGSAADKSAKQLSRAFSAFALHKLLDITPRAAAESVVDDFEDKGIDAIHYRAIRALVVDYEQRAPVRSQERLIYRHGVHVITAVMMKRLRNRIAAAAVVDRAVITTLLSQADTLDQLRQQTFSLGQQRLIVEGPLAYFRNQSNVAAFLADLMEMHFELATDPAVAKLRNIQTAADAYPRKRLLDYLSSRGLQL